MKPLIRYGSDVSASRPGRLFGDKTSTWTYSRHFVQMPLRERLRSGNSGKAAYIAVIGSFYGNRLPNVLLRDHRWPGNNYHSGMLLCGWPATCGCRPLEFLLPMAKRSVELEELCRAVGISDTPHRIRPEAVT